MRGRVLFLATLLIAGGDVSRAVILGDGDGTQNTTAPGNGAPWANVGTVNGASGVYLGSFSGGFWVATATHVGGGDFTLSGVTYTLAAGSAVQIGGSDLTLFRITTNPGVSNLTLSSSLPANGSSITMIGNGLNRDASSTTWFVDTDTNPYTWNTTFFPQADTTATGYFQAAGNTMRWGTNTITGTDTYNVGTGLTQAFYTTFSLTTAQGAAGDSGGAGFYFNGSSWELVGIMGAVGTISGQPGGTAVFGDITAFASMPAYYSQVIGAIPEPADLAWWCGGIAFAAVVVARRRSGR